MKRSAAKRAAILGAGLLATFPIWTLPVAVAGKTGFLAYLDLSNAYYGGARQVFGGALFPTREFGTVPQGAAGLLAAAVLYSAIGATIGCLVTAVINLGETRVR